ncbi:adenylate kinase [Arthrobacter globiformis NBRC 12137]|uniref:Adenylate kinase n=1 Tax=Arthrobacter globiformis (strain ATCC 8010 / DSM 20124 / JCM 1332 / NBRC 12137 / NCIMB 8907 / NRRL B-2979 / 168) TaxID=1077972 RepID=H0QP26_ARTG1|nr:adenylate kinase [Arthrobacter globiformis]GAB14577.1 adenylate kinase [Arthrobacter globiformis NBRC 12137]
MTRILLIGPPGSGKGTQAHRLSGQLHIPEISTGDMFRSHLANGSPLGREIKEFLDAGNLVPDNLTTAMLRERLQERDARNGFLLDGYPRTVSQMDDLDGILDAAGTSLDAVVEITAHDDEIVRRLLLRSDAEGRSDDTEDVIRHRLELYRQETEPVIERYGRRALLVSVDGTADIDAVTVSALQGIEAVRARP